jgi:methyl-accepting chemotaxis protein
VQEQSNVTSSLDVNINGIVSSGQESNGLINQIKVKANELDDHVNNLHTITSQFKV